MTVKSELLKLLEQRKGETLSGEALACELNCTRAAVWKAVNTLREEGYKIEAGPNKGYRLSRDTNLLSEEGIRLYLEKNDVLVKLYREIPSTNQAAKEEAVSGRAGHGSFVIALRQTQGRGRRGRSFYSPEGAGMYLSIILKPENSRNLQESLLITTAAATAVYRAVRKICQIQLDIKWVNDLYYNGRKVCGILTEAMTDFESGNIEYAIVGIGLNIYEEESGFPQELQGVAGSLYSTAEAARFLDRNALAAHIVNELLNEIKDLKLSEEYVSRNIIPGHNILITDGWHSRPAYALSIGKDGRLLVREKDGSESVLSYGEVSVVQSN